MQSRKTITKNIPLKVVSLMLGYTLWHILAHGQTKSVSLEVPLCFHSVPIGSTIEAPETVTVCLTGKRMHLYTLNKQRLAVHVNAQQLSEGPQSIIIDANSLFLPDSIKLVHYIPGNLEITVSSITIS